MPRLLAARWFRITMLFAAINIAGLAAVIIQLQPRAKLEVESITTPQSTETASGGYHMPAESSSGTSAVGTADPFSFNGSSTSISTYGGSDDILVQFNMPMVGPDQIGKPTTNGPLKLDPPVRGSFTWRTSRLVVFQPDEPLEQATQYTAVVPKDTVCLLGWPLGRDIVQKFETGRLQLLRVIQTDYDLEHRMTLALRFNLPVLPSVMEKNLKLTENGKPLGYTIRSEEADSSILLTTEPLTAKAVSITLAKGLKSTAGPLGLKQEVTQTVKLATGLAINGVTGYITGGDKARITISCSQSVDLTTARDAISVEPAVDFSVDRGYRGLELAGDFQPGGRYTVSVGSNLRSTQGEFLPEAVTRSVIVPDLWPALRFRTRGYYMAARGNASLPLEAVNIEKAEVTLQRIYDNNIVHFIQDSWYEAESMGHQVAKKYFTFPEKLNKTTAVQLDLRSMLPDAAAGVYLVTARDASKRYRQDRQLVVLTDLGVSLKKSENDLLVWVNSLATTRPAAGASVTIYTRTNQQILHQSTDERGIAHFSGVDWSGDRQPYAAVVSKGNDITYLDIAATALSTSSFDIAGRPYLQTGYEAFVYSDRGIYRPGESVRLHTIVRGKGCSLPGGFPVQIKVTRPDNLEFKTVTAQVSKFGSVDADIEFPAYAPTGRYTAELMVPGGSPMGRLQFQVEEFLPDRMKVEVAAEEKRLTPGEEVTFTVKAKHLYGAPAAGRTVDARCQFIAKPFSHPDFQGYDFSSSRAYSTISRTIASNRKLDDNGEKTFTIKLPEGIAPPSGLMAVFTATVKEIGGRGVTASASCPADAYRWYFGLARDSKGYANAEQPQSFSCVAIRPDGSPATDTTAKATLSRIEWNTVLKLEGGRYRYVSESTTEEIATQDIHITNGRASFQFTPPKVGHYKLHLANLQAEGDTAPAPASDIEFYCSGADYVPWSMEKPDRLELVADKPRYAPGDTAKILVKAPFSGKALITVESDRVHLARVIELGKPGKAEPAPGDDTLVGSPAQTTDALEPREPNTAEVTIPISAAFAPNAYCSVTLLRPVNPDERWTVHRAYGCVPIMLDNSDHRLNVELAAPERTRPNEPLQVQVKVADSAGLPAKAEVTLAAVDEGICSLTRFETPEPWKFFYGKRHLGVGTSDLYSLLMPEVEKNAIGSDSEEGGDQARPSDYDPRLLNPVSARRVKPVALWKAKLVTDAAGTATATFNVPEFSGQLRLMAVAADAKSFGSTERDVLVRQKLILTTSFPRFLAPGDEFVVPATVFNDTGADGDVHITVETPDKLADPAELEQMLPIAADTEQTALFHLTAPQAPGTISLKVTASLGQEKAESTVEIAVRPTATLHCETNAGKLEAGKTHTLEIPGGWLAGTETCSLSFSSTPALKFARSLQYLVRYPYGCVEQTTSASFPLLYLADVAKVADPETFQNTTPQSFAQAGIDRLLTMQTWEGSFGMWPAYRQAYPWGSVYATHFLVEADKAGYAVPQAALDNALGYLDEYLRRGRQTDDAVKAYAAYVLADAGRPNRSWTYRLHEQRAHLSSYSRAQVACALALMQEADLARQMIEGDILLEADGTREQGGTLDSPTRQFAILLSAYMDIDPENKNVPMLVDRLEQSMKNGYWYTTQENAFALLALGKYIRHTSEGANYTATVSVDGKQIASFTAKDDPALQPEGLGGKKVTVAIEGTGSVYYQWRAEGIPADGDVAEKDENLRVRRKLLGRRGEALDAADLRQGQIVVVEIQLDAEDSVQNLVINDLLPAGLEIENPKLATRDSLPMAGGKHLVPDRVEMRDDRLIIFANIPSGRSSYRYIARAVTQGQFKLPAINAFCMYDPSIVSINGAGTITVTENAE